MATRKLFSLYTVGENGESVMAMLEGTGLDLSQLISRASLLLGIHSANTKLSASFYNSNGELQVITSDKVLQSVPAGATIFFMQKDLNGSPKPLARKLSVTGKPQRSLDSSSSDSISSAVPSAPVQFTEEQSKILKHLESQLQQFQQSLGALATHPDWRALLRKIGRAIQSAVLRNGDVSEELDGMVTPEGQLSPTFHSQLPSTDSLDIYAQHCLDDLMSALAALETSALRSRSIEDLSQHQASSRVVCGA